MDLSAGPDRDAAFAMLNWYRASPIDVPPMDAPFEVPAGWTPPSILAWLEEHGRGPVPQALAYLVEEAGRGHGRIRITRADWVLTGEEELLEALAGSPDLAGRRLRRPVLVSSAGASTRRSGWWRSPTSTSLSSASTRRGR